MIRDSWYKSTLRPHELEFWLFHEHEILFWISCDAWKGQIILRDSVIRKGIGDPSHLGDLNSIFVHLNDTIIYINCTSKEQTHS